jgi:hypothetical protein
MSFRFLRTSLLIAGAFVTASLALPGQARSDSLRDHPQVAAAQPLASQKLLALAKEWFHRLQTANIDRSQLNDTVNLQLTPELVRHEQAALMQYGKPIAFKFDRSGPIPGATGYNFIVTCANGALGTPAIPSPLSSRALATTSERCSILLVGLSHVSLAEKLRSIYSSTSAPIARTKSSPINARWILALPPRGVMSNGISDAHQE